MPTASSSRSKKRSFADLSLGDNAAVTKKPKGQREREATDVSVETAGEKRKRNRKRRKHSVVAEASSRRSNRNAEGMQVSTIPTLSDSDFDSSPGPELGADDVLSLTSMVKGKGKQKASSISGSPVPTTQETQLTEELTATTKLLTAHKSLLTTLLTPLTCQVCFELMHHPFALAPCGHLACYGCLVQWFTTPNNLHEGNQAQPPAHRKKTCPHCRGLVKARPVCVWSVKTLVSTLSASTLLPNPSSEQPAVPPADPWADVFPKRVHNGNGDIEAVGIVDQEDGGVLSGNEEMDVDEEEEYESSFIDDDDYSTVGYNPDDLAILEQVAAGLFDDDGPPILTAPGEAVVISDSEDEGYVRPSDSDEERGMRGEIVSSDSEGSVQVGARSTRAITRRIVEDEDEDSDGRLELEFNSDGDRESDDSVESTPFRVAGHARSIPENDSIAEDVPSDEDGSISGPSDSDGDVSAATRTSNSDGEQGETRAEDVVTSDSEADDYATRAASDSEGYATRATSGGYATSESDGEEGEVWAGDVVNSDSEDDGYATKATSDGGYVTRASSEEEEEVIQASGVVTSESEDDGYATRAPSDDGASSGEEEEEMQASGVVTSESEDDGYATRATSDDGCMTRASSEEEEEDVTQAGGIVTSESEDDGYATRATSDNGYATRASSEEEDELAGGAASESEDGATRATSDDGYMTRASSEDEEEDVTQAGGVVTSDSEDDGYATRASSDGNMSQASSDSEGEEDVESEVDSDGYGYSS